MSKIMSKIVLCCITFCLVLCVPITAYSMGKCQKWMNSKQDYGSVLLSNQRIFFTTLSSNYELTIDCKDIRNGNLVWSNTYNYDSSFIHTETCSLDDSIYIFLLHDEPLGSNSSLVTKIDKMTGSIEWILSKKDFVEANLTCNTVLYEFTDEHIYLLSDNFDFFSINKKTKEIHFISSLYDMLKETPIINSSDFSSITVLNKKFVLTGLISFCFYINENGYPVSIWETSNNWGNPYVDYRELYEYGVSDNETLVLYGNDKDYEDQYLFASLQIYDIETGDLLWKTDPPHHYGRSGYKNNFGIFGDNLILARENKKAESVDVIAYTLREGEIVWSQSFKDSDVNNIKLFTKEDENLVLCLSNVMDYKNLLLKIDASNGEVLFSQYDVIPVPLDYQQVFYSSDRVFYVDTCYPLSSCKESSTAMSKILKFQVGRNSYTLNNETKQMDTFPTIRNNRTLLPARFVTEPLGGSVDWVADERKVVCTLADKIIEFWINKPTAKINGEEVQIDPNNPDVVPTIINDRTMVPMRFLAESLGCEVEWVAETKEIILTYTP